MRILRAVTGTVVVALALTLSGCLQPDPIVTPGPEPSATPVFESDEEALAAAEEAYARFVEVTDQISRDGGAEPERMRDIAVGAHLEAQLEGFEQFRELGYVSTGYTTFDQVALQQHAPESNEGIVTIYVCDDVSGIDVLDASGTSVVSESRPDRTLFQVVFDVASEESRDLLVSSKEPFTDDPC